MVQGATGMPRRPSRGGGLGAPACMHACMHVQFPGHMHCCHATPRDHLPCIVSWDCHPRRPGTEECGCKCSPGGGANGLCTAAAAYPGSPLRGQLLPCCIIHRSLGWVLPPERDCRRRPAGNIGRRCRPHRPAALHVRQHPWIMLGIGLTWLALCIITWPWVCPVGAAACSGPAMHHLLAH